MLMNNQKGEKQNFYGCAHNVILTMEKWEKVPKNRAAGCSALHHASSSVCVSGMELHSCATVHVHVRVGERIGRGLLLLCHHHHHLPLLLLLEHEGMLLLRHRHHLHVAGCGNGIGGVERVVHRLLHHWT